MKENVVRGLLNRALQYVAQIGPGAGRVWLHRLRGVRIGKKVWIGYDTVIETGFPELVSIGDNVTISMRVTIIAHFRESRGVEIGDDVMIGPGVIIMPGVKIGRGAVVTAGSVVTSRVAPMTVVQGNPARAVARNTVPLLIGTKMQEFTRGLRPLQQGPGQ